MALRDYTKQLFADTLQAMMREMPLQKVRVKELCERCGAERQSFYYHFKDKYDLIAWIFLRDYEASLSDEGGHYTVEHAAGVLRRMKKRESFYRKAFSDRSQNAISQYVIEYFTELGEQAVIDHLGEEELTAEARYQIKSHSFACTGHTMEWLSGGSGYTPEEFARLQYLFMPDILKRAYGISDDVVQ